MRSSSVRKGIAPRHPGAARGLHGGAEGEGPGIRDIETAEPACLPPPRDAVPVLDVEEPLLAPDDQKSGDGGEETDDGDDDPSNEAIARAAHATAYGLVSPESIHAHRVLDGVVQPVDGRERRIPNADAVRPHDAFGVEVRNSWAVADEGGRVVGRDRTLGAEYERPVERPVSLCGRIGDGGDAAAGETKDGEGWQTVTHAEAGSLWLDGGGDGAVQRVGLFDGRAGVCDGCRLCHAVALRILLG